MNVKYRVMKRKKPTKHYEDLNKSVWLHQKLKVVKRIIEIRVKLIGLTQAAYPSDINRIFPGLFCIDFYQQI